MQFFKINELFVNSRETFYIEIHNFNLVKINSRKFKGNVSWFHDPIKYVRLSP